MKHNVYLYIFVMAAVTYLIRVLPLTLIRKPIRNRTIRSFLYYVPYVTLAVMTFPSILTATSSPISAMAGFLAAWYWPTAAPGCSGVACGACGLVFLLELFL